MIARSASVAGAAAIFTVTSLLATTPRAASSDASWDAKAAASYLDGRSAWWSTWPTAARDHGTF
ncbi:MAG TPA: hypothetical protein VFA38_11695, partial [Nitrospirales bacterium]|nr:hypothetical protein [Nitrospirales bacterium]